MPGHDIIVIGASAGGVEALINLVALLPADLPASIFVVLHVPAHGPSVLPSILKRFAKMAAVHPADGDKFEHGHIYVAPPDHHLLVKRGYLRLVRGPRENRHRPSVDPLFRTAARFYGARAVAVILSGMLDDGTAGMNTIRSRGGIGIVQDPDEALYPGMPQNAIDMVGVDHILPIAEIASLLVKLAHEEADEDRDTVNELIEMEADMAEMDPSAMHGDDRPGTPSGYGCPECGGSLWELQDGDLTRFRCRTGHAYSADTLLAEQASSLDTALWVALRALEENAALSRQLAARVAKRNNARLVTKLEQQAADAERRAELIRRVLIVSTDADVESPSTWNDTLSQGNGESTE